MPNTKEKLIELLKECFDTGRDFDESADHLIANGVTVQKWIPVSERLPEKSAYYIVMIQGALLPTTLYYRRMQNEWVDDDSEYYNITHWMPLPQPPKGE